MSKAYTFENFMNHCMEDSFVVGDVSSYSEEIAALLPDGLPFDLLDKICSLIASSQSSFQDYGFRLGFRSAVSLLIGCLGDN
ncbi:MAG: hypothetical protein LBK98_04695 [Peptococcaceae bacterium]|jgi:hypothetical protein|nr:hypothetical protein [Peptococcaceae bacterium]